MEQLMLLLLPLLLLASGWGGPPWGPPHRGSHQDRAACGASKSPSKPSVLRAGCLLAACFAWYTNGVASKFAAAAQQQQQQQEQQQQRGGGGAASEGPPAPPEGVEILEVLSPAIDSRPKLLARFPNGLEVLVLQDASALEGGSVVVAASLASGALREPLHLPGLSLLVAHCTFRGEEVEVLLPPAAAPNPLQQQQQQQQQRKRFESFSALVTALSGPQHMHLAVTDTETSVAFEVLATTSSTISNSSSSCSSSSSSSSSISSSSSSSCC
ncbi:hypothetical protein Emed_005276 [Eimeria media]